MSARKGENRLAEAKMKCMLLNRYTKMGDADGVSK